MAELNAEISGIRMFTDCDGRGGYSKLAVIDIAIPSMGAEVHGAMLTWSPTKGWKLAPPLIKRSPIWWDFNAPWAAEMTKLARSAYFAIGGKNPERPTYVPITELELSEDEGLSFRERVEDALDAEYKRRGRSVFTEIFELSEPETKIEIDNEGLHRTLRVDPAVAEACNDAGL